ncbi:MAG: aminotransferase class I/II-fold pyridoxal phosphate-dependent enzyme [Spirochaetes bacterium]|nr:aminotransferase class I/II-fold pyridoxal phosphate-dependent enzyme [Spirochaetota bacterium]
MNNHIRTKNFFNMGTQRALYEREDGYISKEFYISEHIESLVKKYNLNRIIRLDLGQNNDGCDISVAEKFEEFIKTHKTREYMKNYPEFVCRDLRQKIAYLHGIDKDWILLSAGLDQLINLIGSAFLELNDKVLINTPSFFLFEDYSKRMGAIPVRLKLAEVNNFRWTDLTFNSYMDILKKLSPKLIWIANPNNPTGVSIPEKYIRPIIQEASNHYCFVVFDEAYGEYIDPFMGVNSTSKYLNEFSNLIVLRTFSKAYGLANLRVSYAMLNDSDIFEALKLHRPYYPISQFSFDFAALAMDNIGYLEKMRIDIAIRKKFFLDSIRQMKKIQYIDSETSIMMIRHLDYTSDMLIERLEQDGIITSKIPGNTKIENNYIRISLGTEEELTLLAYTLSLI